MNEVQKKIINERINELNSRIDLLTGVIEGWEEAIRERTESIVKINKEIEALKEAFK